MATDPDRTSAHRHRLLILALGVAAGILGANAFADAAGLPSPHMAERSDGEVIANLLRVGCGIVVGLVAAGLLVVLREKMRDALAALGRTSQRPVMAITITLLVCGTLCLLGTLWFEYRIVVAGDSVSARAVGPGMPVGAQVSFGTRSSLAGQLAALGTFLAGASLIGLGVWSSLKPASTAPGPPPHAS